MKKFTQLMIPFMCVFAMMTTNVSAFQSECLNYNLFLADNPNGSDGAPPTLYRVNMTATTAELTEVLTRDFSFHIAYNEQENLIYLVNNNGSGFETIDANSSTSYGVTSFSSSLGNTPTAAYYEGTLYIGSQDNNKIIAYDFDTASFSDFATNIPVQGGDLIVNASGTYLATRTGNKLYRIVDGEVTSPVSIPSAVTGMSFTANGTIAMSNTDSWYINEFDTDGNAVGQYEVRLNGDKLLLRFGDMAGGCNLMSAPNPNDICEEYDMFYSNINESNTDINGITLSGDTADLNLITTLPGRLHISYDGSNGYIYAVDEDATTITTIDTAGNLISTVALADGLEQVIANEFRNGKLYLGSGTLDLIAEVTIATGEYAIIATEIPVGGGDLVFRGDDLILATRTGNRLLLIDTDTNSYTEIADVAPKVSGLALTHSGEYLMSNAETTEFQLLSADGAYIKTYNVISNGIPLNLTSGDLAGGCLNLDTTPCDTILINGGFELENDLSGSWDYVPQEDVPGWSTTAPSGTLEIQADMGTGDMIPSASGDYHFELNGDGLNTLYQGFCTTPGNNLEVTFSHKKRRSSGVDELTLYVGGDLATIESTPGIQVFSLDVDEWETKTFVVDIPEDQNYTYIYFKAVSGTNNTIGNLLDDISVTSTLQGLTDMEAYNLTLCPIQQEATIGEISMYPVPASDQLNIKLNSQVGGSVSYEIVSILGQTFNRGTVEAYSGQTKITADVSNLADGTYFFVVTLNGNSTTKQFVKMRR
jgi:hypothetical protein